MANLLLFNVIFSINAKIYQGSSFSMINQYLLPLTNALFYIIVHSFYKLKPFHQNNTFLIRGPHSIVHTFLKVFSTSSTKETLNLLYHMVMTFSNNVALRESLIDSGKKADLSNFWVI